MKNLETIYAILISAILLYFIVRYMLKDTWHALLRDCKLLFKGQRATGIISEVYGINDGGDGQAFGVVIQFTDSNGILKKVRPDKRYIFSPPPGEKVKIIYLASNSEIAEVRGPHLLLGPLVGLCVLSTGIAVVIFALVRQFD